MLRLRRHGDVVECLPNGFFRAGGRSDDTMNLGGIKVGNAELERALQRVLGGDLEDVAAVAAPAPGGGPSRLWIVAVLRGGSALPKDKEGLRAAFQRVISSELNPLFKVHGVAVVDALPRTASNKVIRRALRTMCEELQRKEDGGGAAGRL